MTTKRFILAHHRSPGDLVCLTALLRDLHTAYPGEFETDVNTTVPGIWDNNPYVTRLWNHKPKDPQLFKPGTRMVTCTYGKGIRQQKHETIHFVSYFHRDFERQTGIKVPVSLPYGDLHLSEKEKKESPVKGRYWLLLTGGKSDFPIKVWQQDYFQKVADRLGALGIPVVQTGLGNKGGGGHWHPKLSGDHVIDLVGWGGFREWLQQVYHADGVLCGITGSMHIAAALQRPCVVIGGGREAWWWEAYVRENRGLGGVAHKLQVPHRYLHTIGLLDCCQSHGCWKDKVTRSGPKDSVCHRPVQTAHLPVGECMTMITPEMVETAILSYYYDGTLPPIPGTQLGQDCEALREAANG